MKRVYGNPSVKHVAVTAVESDVILPSDFTSRLEVHEYDTSTGLWIAVTPFGRLLFSPGSADEIANTLIDLAKMIKRTKR